jgi:tetratricopeptide (TPR) repeat protein
MVTALAGQETMAEVSGYGIGEKTAPRTAGAFLDRGITLASQGEFEAAIADFTEAIRLNSELKAAHFQRGRAYAEGSDYDQAIADFTEAIRLDGNNSIIYRASIYRERGTAYRLKADYDQAITDYIEAIRLEESIDGSNNPSSISYTRIIEDYTWIIRLDPNNAAAYYNRGNRYFKLGNWYSEPWPRRGWDDAYNRAIADYTQVISLVPNSAAAYLQRGNAYHNLGIGINNEVRRLFGYNSSDGYDNYDRAIADYEMALRIDPNNTEAKNNLRNTHMVRGY